MTTFWVNESSLDAAQMKAVKGIALNESFLLRGPAGSGKTNILLLRAKWLKLMALSEYRIVVFTASLRAFIQKGCAQYGIPEENVVTANLFFKEILSEYGIGFESTGDFESDRSLLAGQVKSLLDSKKISNTYEALLVDEAQDYTDTELLIFRKLAPRLMLSADSRQSIYKTTNSIGTMESLVNSSIVELKYHYRTGLKICIVADAILKDSSNYPSIRGESRYDEKARPSSLRITACKTFSEQVAEIVSKLPEQLDLYPGAMIGVMFPKREQQVEFIAALATSAFPIDKERVRVDTIHGAKGWEFQAAHIGGCEMLHRMGAVQKRLIYTGILRARTSVHLYYTGHMPGYLEGAIAKISPPKAEPGWSDLFGV